MIIVLMSMGGLGKGEGASGGGRETGFRAGG